jgi:uncharacterized protein YkwD
MVLRREINVLPLTLLALVCALVVGLLAGAGAQAKPHHKHKDACREWGNTNPTKLKAPQARKSIACFLNKERERRGLHKLDVTTSLNRAAQDHTEYMRRHHCFDHECRGERTLDSRLKHTNYLKSGMTSWTYGENIAWGGGHLGTPKAMVNAWMHSSGHRANILNGRFRDLGMGFEKGSPSSRHANGGIYTTDFGYRSFG